MSGLIQPAVPVQVVTGFPDLSVSGVHAANASSYVVAQQTAVKTPRSPAVW